MLFLTHIWPAKMLFFKTHIWSILWQGPTITKEEYFNNIWSQRANTKLSGVNERSSVICRKK